MSVRVDDLAWLVDDVAIITVSSNGEDLTDCEALLDGQPVVSRALTYPGRAGDTSLLTLVTSRRGRGHEETLGQLSLIVADREIAVEPSAPSGVTVDLQSLFRRAWQTRDH